MQGNTAGYTGITNEGDKAVLTANVALAATAAGGAAYGAVTDLFAFEVAMAFQRGREFLTLASGTTVLGRYPEYLQRARELGANALNVPSHLFNKLGSQAWEFNRMFLDRAISRGDMIIFSSNAWRAPSGTFMFREVQYLQSRGYSIASDGLRAFPK
jgi:hypothetical protein